MKHSKSVSTLLVAYFKLDASVLLSTNKKRDYMSRVPYWSAVVNLIYAMVCTRPNLTYVVSLVNRFMSNLMKAHWKAIEWIMRYLKGTTNICLIFGPNVSTNSLVGYTNSDYGGDLMRKRFLTCYIFILYICAISWKVTL